MHIIITGAKGFVGSVLAARAIEQGHFVTAVDNESRGLNEVEKLPGIRYVVRDCRKGILDLFDATYHDQAVVHLAAATGSLERPLDELRELNVEMTKTVFNDSYQGAAFAFVFPTTSLALGVPDSPYVISKEEAFQWLLAQSDGTYTKNPRVLPFRFFNVTGAHRGFTERRRNEVHCIPTLVECYQKGQLFVVNGKDYDTVDGTPSRDFVHCVDVVDYILYNLTLTLDGQHHRVVRQDDGAIWVGTGASTTVLQAIEEFKRAAQMWATPGLLHYAVSGERRPFDVGALHCTAKLGDHWRPMQHPLRAIRDEAIELLGARFKSGWAG